MYCALTSTAVIVVVFCLSPIECQRFIVPEASVELVNPRGIKISIPDFVEGISLVAIHVNINEEFTTLAHGHYAQDIIKKKDGRWTYHIPLIKVKQGDIIYYWIYAIIEGLGYHGLDRSYQVTQPNPHGGSSPPPPPPPTQDPNQDKNTCMRRSTSTQNGRGGLCQGEELLSKTFDNLDGWSHEIFIGRDVPEEEFTVFTKEPKVISVNNGNLVIQPIMLEEHHNMAFVSIGTLNLEGCTSQIQEECSRKGTSFLILPPVMSARVTSKNSFTFRYGTVEIRAKLPRGDWIVPELWLEPANPNLGDNWGRIVLGMSRGNTDLNSAENNRLLEAGVLMNSSAKYSQLTQDISWGQDFHTFKLVWSQENTIDISRLIHPLRLLHSGFCHPKFMIVSKFVADRLEFSVDGQSITTLTSSSGLRQSFFNEEFYITLGVHVAGRRDFPDSMKNKPWKNSEVRRLLNFWRAKQTWRPTWDRDSALRVDWVKVKAI